MVVVRVVVEDDDSRGRVVEVEDVVRCRVEDATGNDEDGWNVRTADGNDDVESSSNSAREILLPHRRSAVVVLLLLTMARIKVVISILANARD